MYTEENEFNYDDYLDEAEKYNSKKPFFDFSFILKVLAVIILIILIIFLVFKIKNKNYNNKDDKKSIDNEIALVDNMSLIRDASYKYFFDKKNLPENVGDNLSVNINDLIKNELITSVKEVDGGTCSYSISKANLTRNANDYELKINLICQKTRDEKVYYYDLDGKCLTCNGEEYKSSDSIDSIEEVDTSDNNDSVENNNINNQDSDVSKNNYNYSCGVYSSWTTEYKNDSSLERETRTLVKAVKSEPIYGEWSSETTTEIIGNSNLEVKTIIKNEPVTTKTCSSESTNKPASKEGREIESRVVTNKSTKKVCSGGSTYTKKLTKWDNNAYSCRSYGIGKVICTYKTKKTCKNKTVTNSTTYYKYCDTVTTYENKTYYQSRTISYNPIYTDYILESDIPSGYTKVDGSEITEYRYREKCGK